jgi:hypothetical protein
MVGHFHVDVITRLVSDIAILRVFIHYYFRPAFEMVFRADFGTKVEHSKYLKGYELRLHNLLHFRTNS